MFENETAHALFYCSVVCARVRVCVRKQKQDTTAWLTDFKTFQQTVLFGAEPLVLSHRVGGLGSGGR